MNVAWSDAGWRILRWFSPRGQRYHLSRALFIRGMGVIYLVAIWSWWAQAGSLIGREGLLPAADFLQGAGGYLDEEGKSRFWNVPTLFWLSSSDAFISAVCALGLILALLVIAGLAPGPCLAGLWVVYLSLVTTGGVFMNFQWDILLLESGFLAILAEPWAVLRMKWRDPPVLSLGEKLALGLCWFAGGGTVAPLRKLGGEHEIHAVDLSEEGFQLFREVTSDWGGKVYFEKDDAMKWLGRQQERFDAILEDLSVPVDGDVVKPPESWEDLPVLLEKKAKVTGVVITNLLPTPGASWRKLLASCRTRQGVVVELSDFYNRILIQGAEVSSARKAGTRLRAALRMMGSGTAQAIAVRSLG